MKRWTKKEDERLIAIVSENINNLTKAFKLYHAENPKRSLKAIAARWYKVLRVDNNVKVCLVNVKKGSTPKAQNAESFWSRLIRILKRRR